MEKEEIDFLKEKEELYGGHITFRSFATWFASSKGVIRDHGVIIYRIDDTFHYEDFKHRNSILGFTLPESKSEKEHPYVKYESSFRASSILEIRTVKQSAARLAAEAESSVPAKKAGTLAKIFSKLVTAVILANGEVLYMELINPKGLAASARSKA
jgi:hypothetical protein